MPQYAQSQLDPFGGSPTGNNPYYWQAQQGQGTGRESPAFRAMREREAARAAGGGGGWTFGGGGAGGGAGGGGGQPTALDVVQAFGTQGLEAARDPVMAPPQPQLPQPTLPQPMSLQDILAAVPQYSPLGSYGAGAWQQPSYGLPDASQGTPQGGGLEQWAQPGAPLEQSISTGITMPQMQGPPMMPPQQPEGPSWLGGDPSAAYAQAIQSPMAQLQSDYYTQLAPLMRGAEEARAQAGLAWGGLGQGMAQRQGLAQQGQLAQLLQAMGTFTA